MLMSSKEVITGTVSRSAQQGVQYVSPNKVYVSPLGRTTLGSTGAGVNSKEVAIGILQLLNKACMS